MEFETFTSLSSMSESDWDSCLSNDYPFIKYAFLQSLEASKCVDAETGWLPQHSIVKSEGKILGVMPQYFKTHSWGEYVFDQEWANAYHRYGLRYYPKLLNAMPFTPATGPRWSFASGADESVIKTLIDDQVHQVNEGKASSWHCLFPDKGCEAVLTQLDLLKRVGTQFHWFNDGFESFDDFLATFASRKRKNVKKERQAVHAHGFTFKRRLGCEMDAHQWTLFYEFYASTYYKRGHSPHLNLDFFIQLSALMGEAVIVDWVYEPNDNEPIAAALFFNDSDALYGRYWGSKREVDGLHFEVCFYRGIEYAIEKGLKRFDPGAQGEHKISRGFQPVETVSYHYIGHPGFRDAITRFLEEEKSYVHQYREYAAERLPFKKPNT